MEQRTLSSGIVVPHRGAKGCRHLLLRAYRYWDEFIEKKMALEKLKIAAKSNAAHLYFFDESRMSTVPNVPQAWSPLGMPHCADASAPRRKSTKSSTGMAKNLK